jgi:hypothetical protein
MADNWSENSIFGRLLRVSQNERVALFYDKGIYVVRVDSKEDRDPAYEFATKGCAVRRFNTESARYAHMEKRVYPMSLNQASSAGNKSEAAQVQLEQPQMQGQMDVTSNIAPVSVTVKSGGPANE